MDETTKTIGEKAAEKALANQGIEPKQKEPAIPVGHVLVPTRAIDKLVAASVRLKDKPEVIELAKSNPAAMSAFEELGKAVSGVAASTLDKRTFKKDGEPESETETEGNQSGLVLLLLLGIGAVAVAVSKKKEAEAQAAAQAQAALAAQQAEVEAENWGKLGGVGSRDGYFPSDNTGVKSASADAGGKVSGSPLHREG